MSSFDLLHPALQHHIVNSLGWPALRPLQEATIEPVLRGEHAILLAPTAGGKTEAATFPVFSRMLGENWRGLSVLYICPIKALLNNLEPRLSYYGSLLGRRVALWHGDVSPSRKAKIVADPPDILLTTPESLEVMLVSRRIDHLRLFADLQCVIIDEVHAFAGDDRGWHLMYLLERLSILAGRELQRLGLSATVGNPDNLCDWLADGCPSPRNVINPATDPGVHPEIEIDWVGNLNNAAIVISRLHRGEKRLVFCDSRARVEELAMLLRSMRVSTYVSHSCLSLEERSAAEEAFSQGDNCVIVATSTLELGIDVGDLDRVIQIDAPATVSSFLQRIGRTGRRAGTSRNCLFLVTKKEAFLQVAALMQLWFEGYVEPIEPPPLPLHIFAQQIMALALQEDGITGAEWTAWLGRLPGLRDLDPDRFHKQIQYMVDTEILHSDQGILSIGDSGERQFGKKNFMELFSVFLSPPLVKVFHGKQEIGEVHQSTFIVKEGGPCVLTLGGHSWQTKYIDWPRRKAYVEPTELRGRSQWLSSGQPLHYELCQAITRVLAREDIPVVFSHRAIGLMEELREEYGWVEPNKTFLITYDDNYIVWWTFAGNLVNAAIATALGEEAEKVVSDNLSVSFSSVIELDRLKNAIEEMVLKNPENLFVPLDEDFVDELKFSECLPQAAKEAELAVRYEVSRQVKQISAYPLVCIHIHV
ncbi:MAG: DEAD/DEAH box helicase [Candidatus Thiodiazotropha sp. (ex Lucinoma borealis)]|nr:DEAD/DEAH box helicase [Candidatus Thiodiazotropha sp. (ex Lucinoma borealis)]